MKISSINSFNNIQRNTTNFNGLWGKTLMSGSDFVQGTPVPVFTYEAYYYPFIDESRASIDKQVNDNSSSQIVKGPDGNRQLVVKNCKVCAPLPIKQLHYETYKDAEPTANINNNLKYTHISVKDKFVNSGFDNDAREQVSAVNEKIVEALKKLMGRGE